MELEKVLNDEGIEDIIYSSYAEVSLQQVKSKKAD